MTNRTQYNNFEVDEVPENNVTPTTTNRIRLWLTVCLDLTFIRHLLCLGIEKLMCQMDEYAFNVFVSATDQR